MTKKTKQWLIWIGVALFLILLLAIVIKDYMPELRLFADPHGIDQVKLEAMVRSHGLKDMFILGLMIMVMCAVPGMSNAVICVVAGICYGPVIGFLLNWSGDVVGNVLSSYLLNKLHLKAHSARIQQLISNNHPKVMMTLGYMIPFIPSVGLNYAAAVRHVPKKRPPLDYHDRHDPNRPSLCTGRRRDFEGRLEATDHRHRDHHRVDWNQLPPD